MGCLLGGAVGDALGLPYEGLSGRRARRLFGAPPLRQHFIVGRGMISDDTEHAAMTAQALISSGGEPAAFARSLGWRLRGWLLGVPAGVGVATLRSILKLLVGFPATRSGVCSAGNGPAMRAPILGAWLAATDADSQKAVAVVKASTHITHTDERALEGALAIAIAVKLGIRAGGSFNAVDVLPAILPLVRGEELRGYLERIPSFLAEGASTADYAQSLGLRGGVTGYINHTVPVCLFACFRHSPNFRAAIEELVFLGGDTDTTAAIAGGLLGAIHGTSVIPPQWLATVLEFPRSLR